MRKLARALGLIADLAMPALTVAAGAALIVGGSTGVLWL